MLSPASAEAALRAAGAAVAATDAVLHGDATRAFCAVRPPGHHATGDVAMGFCLFNSVAVAAAHAIEHGKLERVAIVDFDVHHGNGTQAIFEHDPRVLYLQLAPVAAVSRHRLHRRARRRQHLQCAAAAGLGQRSLPRGVARAPAARARRLPPATGDHLGGLRRALARSARAVATAGRRLRLAHRRTRENRRPPRGRPDALDARRRIRPAGARRMQRRARGGAVGARSPPNPRRPRTRGGNPARPN